MNILDKIYDGFTFFDGGYGTIYQSKGLKPGELPEKWNIINRETVTEIHYEYLKNGVNILKTNTFGANSLKYGNDGEFSLKNIVEAAITNARNAIERAEKEGVQGPHFVALDIGPLGKLLKPLGDLDFEVAVDIFKETIKVGCEVGVDVILLETFNDIYEAKAAMLAAKEAGNVPYFLTCAYDESSKLLTGADPMTEVAVAEGLGASAIGINCSLGPENMIPIVKTLCEYASIPIICNPNAGLPKTVDGKTVFEVEASEFSEDIKMIANEGAVILGGCCGTTPEHIGRTVKALSDMKAKPVTQKSHTLISSYTHCVSFGDKAILIGERINPTGKKKFKEALRENNIDYILNEGLTQQEKGAHVLDVNVGLPEIDEVSMMETVVKELQAVTDLPLQIDTTNTEAMEKALRIYNGKAMINSVNGKEEVMNAIFPLVKKYGGLLVALTIDEDGIPESAEGRAMIASRIYKRAEEYGIDRKDIIIDPLCMSISAAPESAKVTLEALNIIKKRLGGRTSLGVSNISFGLPERDMINGTFFALALQNGLDAAIMNPGSVEMMKAYKTFMALNGMDESFSSYIDFASVTSALKSAGNEVKNAGAVNQEDNTGDKDPLTVAIVKGLKERAASLTADYLVEKEALEIIDSFLIPALDIVGKGFEEKKMFLPQLLMSAEAASASFDVIKRTLDEKGQSQKKKGSVVLATVKGDIHDIGKNIVKTLLENYGYNVIDLGKDVPPEIVAETVIKNNIKMVGLSALMTTTVPAMQETIELLKKKKSEAKICVGGAVLTQEYADMIGADKYSKDAMDTVRYAEEVFAVKG